MKKAAIILGLILLHPAGLVGQTATKPTGEGTAGEPYKISTWEHLYWISASDTEVADPNRAARWAAHYRQTEDIEFPITGDHDIRTWDTEKGWTPIGNNTTTFTGSYDASCPEEIEGCVGGRHIQNLYIDRPETPNVGFFGHIGAGTDEQSVIIRGVILENVQVVGARGTGSLAGRVTGSIYNLIEGCAAFGGAPWRNVTGDAAVGGLVGSNNSVTETPGGSNNPIISKSYAHIDVLYSGESPGGLNAEKYGGLTGCNQKGTIRDSYALGSVTAHKEDTWSVFNVGGLTGCILWRGRIERSYSVGVVTGTGATSLGGLVGNTGGAGGNAGVVQSGYWDIENSGQTASAGGTGLTSEQMKQQASFQGFDFTDVWEIDEGAGGPTLRDVPETLYITWTGSTDADWNTTSNWNPQRVPNGNDVVVIPRGLTTYPLIGDGTTGVSLGISLIGPAAADKQEKEEPASITIGPGGKLRLNSFILNGTGKAGLLIQSDDNGTGSLLHTTQMVEATVERYITGAPNAWHLLSSPAEGQRIDGGPTKTPDQAFDDGSVFAWFEPSQSWVNFRNISVYPTWGDVNNATKTFQTGRGYLVAYPANSKTNPTKTFTGTLLADSASVLLRRFAHPDDPYVGFNLIGNPFPSGLDWKAENGWAGRENLSGDENVSYWVWNDAEGNYGVYSSGVEGDVGTLSVTRTIAPMQGFWVRSEAHGVRLRMFRAARIHPGDQPWLKEAGAERQGGSLRLLVNGPEGRRQDEILLEFGHGCAAGGAEKMFSHVNDVPSLYVAKEGGQYSISFHEPLDGGMTVELGFRAGTEGVHRFRLGRDVPDGPVVMKDRLTGIAHRLDRHPEYHFFAFPGPHPNRFALLFGEQGEDNPTALPDVQGPMLQMHVYEGMLHLLYDEQPGSLVLEVFDLGGRRMIHRALGDAMQHQEPLHLAAGLYVVRITGATHSETRKIALY